MDEVGRFWFLEFFAFQREGSAKFLKSFVIRLTFISEINTDFYAVPTSAKQLPINVVVVSTLGGTGSVNGKLHYLFLQRKAAVIFLATIRPHRYLLLFFFSFSQKCHELKLEELFD